MAIITISGGTFSYGKSLAECISSKLGYRCVSREMLEEVGKRYHIPEEELYDALLVYSTASSAKKIGLLDLLMREKSRYLMCIRAALIRKVNDEKVVYHGSAGHVLLKGAPHVLRVRVVANKAFRLKAALDREHLGSKADDERVRWLNLLYDEDCADPSLFDIVIDIDHLDIPDACDIVCRTASLEQYETTPESQKAMNDLVLATEVRAVIAVSEVGKGIADGGIEIDADEGVVTACGRVASVEDADKIRKIIMTVSHVREVNSRIEVAPH